MSGGKFDYDQYRICGIADSIQSVIDEEERVVEGEGKYSGATLYKFVVAIETLKRAAVMAQRVDWLLSSDDGEEAFHARWSEDLREIRETPSE